MEEVQLRNSYLRYKSHEYRMKTQGKKAAAFVCTTVGCYASISLEVVNGKTSEPYTITHRNEKHKAGCEQKDGSYFETKDFMDVVKTKIASNPSKSVMQLYEETRTEHRATSDVPMPDFKDFQSGLNKRKARICKKRQYASSAEIGKYFY
jgi:hypothetical protein